MFLLCSLISLSAVKAQGDWFERAFPNAGQVSKAASPIRIEFDYNVICVGGSSQMHVNHSLYGEGDSLYFEWFLIADNAFQEMGNGSAFVYKPTVEQTLRIGVRGKDRNLLVGTDTITVYSTHLPEYTTVYDTICPGLEATVGVNGGNYWAWSTSGTSSFINIRPPKTTVYYVRISEYPIVQTGYSNACYAEDSAIVTVNDSASFTLAGTWGMCSGLAATVRVEGGTDVLWNGEGGGNSHSFVVTHDTLIQVTATDRYGCRGTKDWRVQVVETPHGEIFSYVDGELSDSVCLGSMVRLEVETDVECSYRWFNRDTVDFVELIPQNDFTAYCDISVGGAGTVCKAHLEKHIAVKNCHNVYFASGFVLDGYTKTYGPIGENDTTRTYEFRIFNHNGTMVYSTTDFTKGWDGRYKGQWVPVGVYVYQFVEKYRQHRWVRRGTFAVIK